MLNTLMKYLLPPGIKTKLREKLGVPTQGNSLKNLRKLGFAPKFCLDIGAYEGYWTQAFKQIFPDCSVTMFEGQASKEASLRAIGKAYQDVNYKIALLGAEQKLVSFNIYDTASSVLTEHNDTNAKTETRQLITLDCLLENETNNAPDFIKIDTQGYELEILKGGEKTLQYAEFVLLEVSFLDIYIDCPLVADTLSFMKARGFVVYDICSLMKRPLDGALFQSDFLFIKENSRFRKDKRWS